jgi:hypothetical protein
LYTELVDGGCAEGVTAGWVTADSAYGRDGRFRAFLQAHRMPYVVEVPVRHTITDLDGRRRVDTLCCEDGHRDQGGAAAVYYRSPGRRHDRCRNVLAGASSRVNL